MALHNKLGQEGEEAAMLYLVLHGYHLEDKNWRIGHYEIDIVASYFGTYVFVEVKSRSTIHFGDPLQAVDTRKKLLLNLAAHAYMRYHKLFNPVRFDVITLVGAAPSFNITHHKAAFTTTLHTYA